MIKMDTIYLGTNWKMHKTLAEAKAYTQELLDYVVRFPQFRFFVIPPYTDLWGIREMVKHKEILIGAQNMHYLDEGAHTGEISPRMLSEIGVDIIEIGHSERRQFYGETDFFINEKTRTALQYGFTPLVCIGEPMIEKEFDTSLAYLDRQIRIAMHGVTNEQAKKVWIAYEPVWAIGENGIPAEPEYVGVVHAHIRKTLGELFGKETAAMIPILFGGSVNEMNTLPYLEQEDVNGLFIGRAAWDAKSFLRIMKLIDGWKREQK